jgi:8-oxo-dGTP pyrophosphatase MutT (NUDIX family)
MRPQRVAELRDVLLDPIEAAGMAVRGSVRAAVLVALFERDGELWAVFTKRREDLRLHPGQISFPGGRVDPLDGGLIDTALREAEEEIGLPATAVTALGALTPIWVFVSDFALYPLVGAIDWPQQWTVAEQEVEVVLELPLHDLARNYVKKTLTRGTDRIESDTYTVGGHFIWGATGRVLTELLERLGLLEGGAERA